MKFTSTRVSITTLIINGIALTAFAGPGPQYWQVQAAAAAANAPTAAAPAFMCPGSKEVPVMAKVPAWPNGKGPLVDQRVGTKKVCTICPVREVASTGWSNGRGPATKAETLKAGAAHDCTPACAVNKS